MPSAWFVIPYVEFLHPSIGQTVRRRGINLFGATIKAEGGDYDGTEILGNQEIVKVQASESVLLTIAGTPGIRRIPIDRIDDPLSEQPQGVRNAIRQEVLNAGYTVDEVNRKFPNIANATLREVLRFMATKRLKARYDPETDSNILDGPEQTCKSIDLIDSKVR